MAYSEELAERVRTSVTKVEGVTERKMFGGLAFMLDGNMFCGVVKDELMVRVVPERYEHALALPRARPMDFTGRPMRGMVFAGPPPDGTDAWLHGWLELALGFARSLPAKTR